MLFRRSFTITTILILTLGIGFIGGLLTRSRLEERAGRYPILDEANQILSEHALKATASRTGFRVWHDCGMLQAYDEPYTVFVEPVQHELETNTLQGSFGGIGVRIGRDDGGNVILYLYLKARLQWLEYRRATACWRSMALQSHLNRRQIVFRQPYEVRWVHVSSSSSTIPPIWRRANCRLRERNFPYHP